MVPGKVLIVDLGRQQFRTEELPVGFLEEYLGGRGLAARLMWDWARPPLSPLAPENKLIFSVGPIQGTGISYETKAVVSTMSPLTGLYLFTVSGGQLGPTLGRSGYNALIFEGAAASPTYVWIEDDKVEFRDARHLWGKKVREAQKAILNEVEEEEAVTVVIGPAGENLVKYAAILTEGDKVRAFGRGGAGAVMGAKKLKGFAIKASGVKPISDPGAYLEAVKGVAQAVRGNERWMKEWAAHGTRTGLETLSGVGILPTKNWWTGVFDKAGQVASYFHQRSQGRGVPCGDYCITPCSIFSQVSEGPWTGHSCEGPEYETIYALGSNCCVGDGAALIAAQGVCDDWGLDTISAGVAISFAMECFEKGLITKEDTGGLELSFGNAGAMLKMVEMIALRQGLGNLLAEGVKAAAREIGRDSAFFAIHGKGLELGGYECRISFGQALQFALSPRGGCHHDLGLPARMEMYQGTGTEIKGKGNLLRQTALGSTVFDSSVLCTFSRAVLGLESPSRLISAIWGQELSQDDLRRIADRILCLERAINARFGVRRADDTLPGRMVKEGYPEEGPKQGLVVPLEELKDEFYSAFGWDLGTGLPSLAKLNELGLNYVAQELYPT